jgi:hypothetical protein
MSAAGAGSALPGAAGAHASAGGPAAPLPLLEQRPGSSVGEPRSSEPSRAESRPKEKEAAGLLEAGCARRHARAGSGLARGD